MKTLLISSLLMLFSMNLYAQADTAPSNEEWQHDRQEWTLPLPSSGAIKVENSWGDIRVRTHDNENIYVLANIQHHQQDPRAMSLVIDDESDDLGLNAYFASDANNEAPAKWQPRRIDLTVFVPAKQALKLMTTKGLAEVRGLQAPLTVKTETGEIRLRVKGSVDAYTDYGSMQVVFLRTDWPQASRLESLTGEIEAIFPKGGRTQVKLETRGQITSDFSLDLERDEAQELKTGIAHVGKKGRELLMKSNRGNLKLLSSVIPDEAH